MSEETGHSVLVQAKIYETGRLVYSLPYITQDIPVGIVFKSLGVDLSELQKLIPEKYYKVSCEKRQRKLLCHFCKRNKL